MQMEPIIIFEEDPIDISTEKMDTTPKIELNTDRIDTKPSLDETTPTTDPGTNKDTDIKYLPTQPTYPLQERSKQVILHPIVYNSGIMTVPSLSANIMDGQLVTLDPSKLVMRTPQIALQNGGNIDIIKEPNQVTDFLKKLSHQAADIMPFITSYVPEVSSFCPSEPVKPCTSVQLNSYNIDSSSRTNTSKTKKKKVKTPRKLRKVPKNIRILGEPYSLGEPRSVGDPLSMGEPCSPGEPRLLVEPRLLGEPRSLSDKNSNESQLRTDRTDWEDKIPMDVISFVVSCLLMSLWYNGRVPVGTMLIKTLI